MTASSFLSRAAFLSLALTASAPAWGDPPSTAAPPTAPTAERGWLGIQVEPLAVLSAKQKADLRATGDRGVVVAVVIAGGPSDAAGVKPGDLMLRFGGKDVPDLASTEEEPRHLWRVAMNAMTGAVKAGESVEMVYVRGAERRTAAAKAVGEAEAHRLQADPSAPASLPSLAQAGAPEPMSIDFEGLAAGVPFPAGFHPYEGRWRVAAEPGAARPNAVLRQGGATLPWAVLLVAGRGRAFADATASVRFLPASGIADASGGIVFRAQDARNYYLARPNALEDNFRLYVVKDGVRTQLATATVAPPAIGTWHSIEVTCVGPTLKATLDGANAIEAKDQTYASGWCGLWTKADSVSLFDDLRVSPAAAPPGR